MIFHLPLALHSRNGTTCNDTSSMFSINGIMLEHVIFRKYYTKAQNKWYRIAICDPKCTDCYTIFINIALLLINS